MNDQRPLLTIAVPTFNRADALARLLDVLIEQINQVEDHVELLISDNASTDSTGELTARESANRPFITLLRNNVNLGADENFARCMDAAAGEYIWLLGDDDLILPGSIIAVLHVLRHRNTDALFLGHVRAGKRPSATTRPMAVRAVRRADLAREAHFLASFISVWVLNAGLVRASDTRRYLGTSLAQCSWVFSCLNEGSAFQKIDSPIVVNTKANYRGYAPLRLWASEYPRILEQSFADSKSSRRLGAQLRRRVWLGVVPRCIVGLRLKPAKALGFPVTFSDVQTSGFYGRLWREVVLRPLHSWPIVLALPFFSLLFALFMTVQWCDRVRSRVHSRMLAIQHRRNARTSA